MRFKTIDLLISIDSCFESSQLFLSLSTYQHTFLSASFMFVDHVYVYVPKNILYYTTFELENFVHCCQVV